MRQRLANIALVVASIVITLLLLELALFAFYPAHEVWKLKSVPDPELGWTLKPKADYRRQVPGALVRVRYNAEGFRDVATDIPAPDNALRVVVLGDSFMEANMVPLDAVFHKQLERLAQQDSRTIRTWNLGVRGYGTLQEYLTYRKAGAKHEPDLVLVAFYLHNDVRNNAEHLNVAAKRARGGGRKRPFLDEDSEEWRILEPDYASIRTSLEKLNTSLASRIRSGSVLLTLLRNAGDAFDPDAGSHGGAAALTMHMCGGEDYDKAWRTTERIFERLKLEVEKDGARLVVFSVPAIFDVDMDALEGMVSPTDAARFRDCVEDSPGYKRLQSTLDRNGISYVDTRPAFRRFVDAGSGTPFVKGDWHWNGAGHALAAKEVYQALMSRNLLQRP